MLDIRSLDGFDEVDEVVVDDELEFARFGSWADE